jgi:hypothetical protein
MAGHRREAGPAFDEVESASPRKEREKRSTAFKTSLHKINLSFPNGNLMGAPKARLWTTDVANSFPPVQIKFLTGPVKHGVLPKVNCFARNPSAEMRGGFLR